MSTPHQCPVCDGAGKLFHDDPTGLVAPVQNCHVCGGRGIVWEPAESNPCESQAVRYWTGDATPKPEGMTA